MMRSTRAARLLIGVAAAALTLGITRLVAVAFGPGANACDAVSVLVLVAFVAIVAITAVYETRRVPLASIVVVVSGIAGCAAVLSRPGATTVDVVPTIIGMCCGVGVLRLLLTRLTADDDAEGPDRGRRLSLAALGSLGLGVIGGVTGEVLARVTHPAKHVGATSDQGTEDAIEVTSDWGPEEAPTVQAPTAQPNRTYTLNVNGFTQALHTALTGSTAGYALKLRQGGSPIATTAWNWAKEPQDTGEQWTPDVRMHIASVSKLITAMAMTKLLDDKGIGYDTPIIGYLPDYWAKGPNINEITFAELMTHRSGLAFGNTVTHGRVFQFMKSEIAAGTTRIGQYKYPNVNFELCRILIATVNGDIAVDCCSPPESDDAVWNSKTLSSYRTYVTDNVFSPAGVSGPTLTHEPADALAYNFPVSEPGWNSGDVSPWAGAAGWHMSVDEVLNVMGAFRRNGTIMSSAQAQTMLDNKFGIDQKVPTPLGTYYAKNGGWSQGARTDPNRQEEQCIAFFFPQNTEFMVLVNSPIGSPSQGLYKIVATAYTDNIVAS